MYYDHLNKILSAKDISSEITNNLEAFASMVLKWNKTINLVSKKTTRNILWQRHILDSAQLIKYIPQDTKRIIDFGSGAGFPAIILSIFRQCNVILVESDKRKCAFLQDVASKLSLDIKIINSRIEKSPIFDVDFVTARALAPLVTLLEYSEPFLNKDNIMLFLKGKNVIEEIEEALIFWEFSYEIFPDLFNEEACVLKVFNARRL